MAILAFLFRFRIAVLALLGLVTAGAAWFAFHAHAIAIPTLLLSGASLAVVCFIGFLHMRHLGLALLGAVAPLPGMFAAAPLAMAGGLGSPALLAVYGLAAVAAACLSGGIVRRILDAAAPEVAAQEVLVRAFAAASLAAFAGSALIAGWMFREGRALGLGGAAELVAAMLSVVVVVPFASAVLRYGEPFFVTANRARERREDWLVTATLVVEPRWAFALSGAMLVLATLGWFGAEPVLMRNAFLAQPAYWAASALLAFLVAFAAGRDWRDALAATVTLAVLMLLGILIWSRAGRHVATASFVELTLAAAAALFLMLMLILRSRRYRTGGDAADVARLRAIEDAGWAPWFGILGAAAACAPWLAIHGSIVILAAMLLLAGALGLIGMPALSTALERLVPRRRSLGELYGRG